MGYISCWYIASNPQLRSCNFFFFWLAFRKNHQHACWTQVNFAGLLVARACNGCCYWRRMFSYVGTVSQAVAAAMSQVVRRHMWTRLKALDKTNYIHAFVTSRLDYCNSLLSGLPQNLLQKLLYVQNFGARLLSFTQKTEHITPILKELHWLPVAVRIEFKILVLVFKAYHGIAPLSDMIT